MPACVTPTSPLALWKTTPIHGRTAVHIPKLGWVVRAFYGATTRPLRSQQSPSAASICRPAGNFFLAIARRTDEQREFGLTIPFADGLWIFPTSRPTPETSSITTCWKLQHLPAVDHRESASSRLGIHAAFAAYQRHLDLYLTYSNQQTEGGGLITGGLLADPGQPAWRRTLLSRSRSTQQLSTGFMPRFPIASPLRSVSYGSGF